MIRRSLAGALLLACASLAQAAGHPPDEPTPPPAPAEQAPAPAQAEQAAPAAEAPAPVAPPAPVVPSEPLGIKDTKVGKGKEAMAGMEASVHYTGWLHDPKAKNQRGKKFDSSIGRGPFVFPLGGGRVIKGWDQGVVGMKVGGKRTLTIPAELAYGARNVGDGLIPPNSKLVFDVQLLNVK